MPKLLVTGAGGLYSSVSDFIKPPNAMAEATNIRIRDNGLSEPRPGMIKQASTFDLASPGGTLWYTGRMAQFGNNVYYPQYGKIYCNTSGWVSVSDTIGSLITGKYAITDFLGFTLNIPQQNMVAALQNLYVSSGNGLYMTDTVGNQLYKAGFDTPPEIVNATLSSAGAQGAWQWVDANSTAAAVAYRVVWGRKDAHLRVTLSEPSGRTIVKKTSGANTFYSVSGDVPTIPECSSSTFYQVYRSSAVDTTSAANTPSDNLYQVYEGLGADALALGAGAAVAVGGGGTTVTITKTAHGYRSNMKVYVTYAAGDIGVGKFASGLYTITKTGADTFTYVGQVNAGAAYPTASAATVTPKYFPFVDQSPDNLLTKPLYTNPMDSADPLPNHLPPASCDLAYWKNRMWYANTNGKHQVTLSLLGTFEAGSPPPYVTNADTGLRIDDTITINGMAFVAAAAAIANSLTFKVFTAEAPEINIDKTARSLVDTINNYTGNTTIRAFYQSSDFDFPGIIRLERVNQSDASFTVTVARPAVATDIAALAWSPYIPSGITSKNDDYKNRLYYSKPVQPEAVPALNYIDVGAGDKRILRILPVKESLFVLKEDGVFIVTGDYPFRLDLMDGTSVVQSEASVVAGESCLYGLFNTGFCRVDSTGVKVLSVPIADSLRTQATVLNQSICALNEVDGLFICKVTSSAGGGVLSDPTVWHCYNIKNQAWSTWDFALPTHSPEGMCNFDWGNIRAVLFVKNSTSNKTLLYLTYNSLAAPDTNSLAIERRVDAPLNANLNCMDGSLTESTSTVVTGWAYNTWLFGAYKTLVLNSAFSGGVTVNLGDIIYIGPSTSGTPGEPDSGSFYGLITAINSSTSYTCRNIAYYSNRASFTSIANGATVRLLRAYKTRVAYCVNNPSTSRHYRDVTYMFERFVVNAPRSIITTDQNSTEVNSSIIFTDSNVSNTTDTRFKRILFPAGHQYANAVTVGIENWEAGTFFRLMGVGVCFEDVSERNSR